MLQKKRNVFFFQVFFCLFLFQWLLETLTWETSNQKWQCPTDQGQALFRAMQMWKFTCFAVVAARQKQQEESEEAGNLWNLLVFRPWDLFKICLRFRWKSLTGEVKPCALSIEDGFSEDLEEWVQLYSDSDHLVKESDIYATSVLVVYPEIQASCSYLKCMIVWGDSSVWIPSQGRLCWTVCWETRVSQIKRSRKVSCCIILFLNAQQMPAHI